MSRRKLPPEIEIDVRTLNDDGTGLGWYGERAVHVKGALPGEQVIARILRKRRGVIHTEIVSGSNDGAHRVASACEHFPRCGGCALHHMDYDRQVALKSDSVVKLLNDAKLSPQIVHEPVTGDRVFYRRKARLGVRTVGPKVFVGFRESFNSRVVNVPRCRTLDHRIGAILQPLTEAIASLDVREHIPQIEVAAGEMRVSLCVRHLVPLEQSDRERLLSFARENAVEMLVQSAGYDTVQRLEDGGSPTPLDYSIPRFGVNLLFSPVSFVQVNGVMNQRIVDHVVAGLDIVPGESVADLFCGIGNLSLPMARVGARVVGYESEAQAIDWAKHNALRNGLSRRCDFKVADLYSDLAAADEIKRGDARFDGAVSKWVLDPPRSGAGPQLEHWLAQRPDRIAYVSCNPVTFASDGEVLARNGYQLSNLTMFDMFPHTAHIEVMGIWQRG